MFSTGPFRVTDIIKRLKNKYPTKKSVGDSPNKMLMHSSLDYVDTNIHECKQSNSIIIIGV